MEATIRWISVLAVLTVLAAGALVNSEQASLSVPDWPKSYGMWVLPMPWVGGIRFEHSHRLLVAAAAVLLVALPFLMRGDPRRKRLASAAFVLYVVQVALGGAIVLLIRPRTITALHGIVAQSVTVLILLAAAPTSGRRDPSAPLRAGAGTTRWVTVLSFLIILQPIAGVLSRHPLSKEVFIVALLTHLLIVLVLLIVLPTAAIKLIRHSEGMRFAGILLLVLFVAQLIAGGMVFILAPEPLDETWPPPRNFPQAHVAHVLLAACLIATTLWIRNASPS